MIIQGGRDGGGYEETCQKRQGSLGNATGLPKHFLKDCFQEGREGGGGGGGRREEGIPFLVKQKKNKTKKTLKVITNV